jgi:hypothetical protein
VNQPNPIDGLYRHLGRELRISPALREQVREQVPDFPAGWEPIAKPAPNPECPGDVIVTLYAPPEPGARYTAAAPFLLRDVGSGRLGAPKWIVVGTLDAEIVPIPPGLFERPAG